MQNKVQPAVLSESLARKHEANDPHLRNVLIIAASVVVMVGFCLATGGILIHAFSRQRPMQSMQPLGIISAPDLKPLARFSEPNLQIDDGHVEMAALILRQKNELNSYGWIDRSNGIVRIPIDRAMDLLAQRGLPSRTNSVSPAGISPLQLIQERPAQQ